MHGGQRLRAVEDRPQQEVKRGEAEVRLGLGAAHRKHRKSPLGRLANRRLQKIALADSRLADQVERFATTREPIESRANPTELGVAPDERQPRTVIQLPASAASPSSSTHLPLSRHTHRTSMTEPLQPNAPLTRMAGAPDEIDAGHCVALSRPRELAERLESYFAALPAP
jgi:hypothetical protein